jgi:hypothetical protein
MAAGTTECEAGHPRQRLAFVFRHGLVVSSCWGLAGVVVGVPGGGVVCWRGPDEPPRRCDDQRGRGASFQAVPFQRSISVWTSAPPTAQGRQREASATPSKPV